MTRLLKSRLATSILAGVATAVVFTALLLAGGTQRDADMRAEAQSASITLSSITQIDGNFDSEFVWGYNFTPASFSNYDPTDTLRISFDHSLASGDTFREVIVKRHNCTHTVTSPSSPLTANEIATRHTNNLSMGAGAFLTVARAMRPVTLTGTVDGRFAMSWQSGWSSLDFAQSVETDEDAEVVVLQSGRSAYISFPYDRVFNNGSGCGKIWLELYYSNSSGHHIAQSNAIDFVPVAASPTPGLPPMLDTSLAAPTWEGSWVMNLNLRGVACRNHSSPTGAVSYQYQITTGTLGDDTPIIESGDSSLQPSDTYDVCFAALNASDSYSVRVRALDMDGDFGHWSDASSFNTLAWPAPPPPPDPPDEDEMFVATVTPTPAPTSTPIRQQPTAIPTPTPTPRPASAADRTASIAGISIINSSSMYRPGKDEFNELAVFVDITPPAAKNTHPSEFLGYKLGACRYLTTDTTIPAEDSDDQACGVRLRGLGGNDSATVRYGGSASDRDNTPDVPHGGYALSDAPVIYFWLITFWTTNDKGYSSVYTFVNPLMDSKDTRPGYEIIIPPYGSQDAVYTPIEGQRKVSVSAEGVSLDEENYYVELYNDFQTRVNELTDYESGPATVGNNADGERRLIAHYDVDIPGSAVLEGEVNLFTRARIRHLDIAADYEIPGDPVTYHIPAYYPAYTRWTDPVSVPIDEAVEVIAAPEFLSVAPEQMFMDPLIEIVNLLDPPAEGSNRTNTTEWIIFACLIVAMLIVSMVVSVAKSIVAAAYAGGFFFLLAFGWGGIALLDISPFIVGPLLMLLIIGGGFLLFKKPGGG